MFTTSLKLTAAILTASLLLISTAQADDQSEARKLILEAAKLTQEADPLYRRSNDLAYIDIWKEARGKLQQVIDNYPTTNEGMTLSLGGDVYGLSTAVLDKIIEEETRRINRRLSLAGCTTGVTPASDPQCDPHRRQMAAELIKKGEIDEAIAVVQHFKNPQKTYRTLASMGFELARSRNRHNHETDMAFRLLLEAITVSKDNDYPEEPTSGSPYLYIVQSFELIIGDEINQGNFDRAASLAYRFPFENHRDEALKEIERYRKAHQDNQ